MYRLFDIFFIIFITCMMIWTLIDKTSTSIPISLLMLFIGITFLFSNKIKELSFFGKLIYWLSFNIFLPRLKYNHIIWGSIFVIIAVSSFFVTGLKGTSEPDIINFQNWWYKDPLLWIVILILIIFCLFRLKDKK